MKAILTPCVWAPDVRLRIYGKMPRSIPARPPCRRRAFSSTLQTHDALSQDMTETVALKIVQRIATELAVQPRQVAATVQLLDEGSTVPFIARYRKEITGNLDDTQLRQLEERLLYLRELEDRRATILASIDEQGKLSDALRAAIEAADSKQVLEDLYLPYKPKRRTRAQIAREAGLEPLAQALLANPLLDPQAEAAAYVDADKGVADVKAALDGARDILSEQFGETAELLGKLRDYLHNQGVVSSSVVEGKENEEGEKFRDYYDYSETLKTVPSHRALALFRGRNAGVLMVKLGLGKELDAQVPHPGEAMIARHAGIANQGRPADKWLSDVCRWCWRVKVQPHLETELLSTLREDAENEAIRVFARNLKDLLLAAPAGPKAVIGLDPGLRTGVKVAIVDRTGKVLATDTIFPHEPRRDWDGSIAKLARLAAQTQAELISIGNGTASRETDKLASELIAKHPELKLQKIVVSEAGASIYSASELAAKEFPDLDVTLRGAVSIARRLQDPLAELVKIEPKAIGVGQYQHDVNQRELARSLDAVVEDCVNAVGVDANTASAALLARVSGLNATLARNIVEYRDANGPFPSRDHLRRVPRLGDKTFEQAAGFLRINGGDNPLDRSSVHPEAYPVVERILARISKRIDDVLGQREALSGLSPADFVDERFGLPTVRDILGELEKPGRDPRPEFKTATFRDGVEKVSDLVPGMVLEGVVTNVAAFGAFVDIGVHQDGLVHVSAMSTKFIKDPHEVVKAGQVVKVKVLEVDVKRQRIALTMRLADEPGAAGTSRGASSGGSSDRGAPRGGAGRPQRSRDAEPAGAMAAAFAKLKR
ncbi:MAG: Protein YhgF [Burkholderia plantarii]|nr:MAG: Protein YhgF [Burkholderia plantarii]